MLMHNDINKDIKFLAKSEIRLKILNELNKKPNNIKGIAKMTNITYSSISSNVLRLEKQNYIVKKNDKFYIAPMTKIYFKTLMDFKNSIEMIKNYNTFWDKHNLSNLSISSVKEITDLENANLIEATPVDIFKTHNTIKKQLLNSKNVKAIFPYLHPEYPKIIEEILKNKGKVELILPQYIFKELIFRIDGKIRRKSVKNRKLKIYNYKSNLNIYLTICDMNMSLGLFKTDGSFDQNRLLISDNEKSYKWADDLFENVKTQVIG